MPFASFWLKNKKKIFQTIALLSLLLLLPILGNVTGIYDNDLLFKLFISLDPNLPLEDLPSYYYQALILDIWFFLFALINLKYFLNPKEYEPIQFGKISALASILFILFFFISPRPYVVDYKPLTQYESLLYHEDGIFEIMTAVFLFLAALGFFHSGVISIQKKLDSKIVFAQFFLGSFCLFFCMEEISWGQRILNVKTPEWAERLNSQDETNIHNICNEIFHTKHCLQFLQIIFNTLISLAILLLAGLKNQIQQPALQGLLQLEKYYFLAILIAIATVLPNELNEELISLFFLSYSYDVWKFYRNFQPLEKTPT
ncbi:MAG: hypothetical protein NPINA01_27040 [Nitrospinaceae bacterium]|nr:MAG: hypothetical protein NPINA01_27040 [Nitrospinaceae bacterium]